jgi:hypothetical protein
MLIDPQATEGQRVLQKAFEDFEDSAATIAYLRSLLSEEGARMSKNHKTNAGRALQKHNDRPNPTFTTDARKAWEYNRDGQRYLDDILNNPNSKWEKTKWGGIDVTAPNGQTVRYNPDGTFAGFREPKSPPKR